MDADLMERAIWRWLKAATGLPDAQIVWADQNVKQPPNPFLSLRIRDTLRIGSDYTEHTYDASAAAGQEIVQTVRGLREFTLGLQAFTSPVVGNDSARALLAKVDTSVLLEENRLLLAEGGLVAFDAGPVLNLSALGGADFEGRAALDVRFYVSAALEARTGYIARVTLTDETAEPDATSTVEVPTE